MARQQRHGVCTLLASLAAAAALPIGAWAASPAEAPAAAAAKRPKICLVLSGGGARGAAHVGVIKVLEAYRVPIDCVAGTSMGALVGGAFASGMTVSEMEKITDDITVEKLFKERPPRQDLSMRRKADDYRNYVGPEVGTGASAATLTKGVVTGVQLETVLRQLSRVQGFVRFDDMPIQFRAVATDLVTGKAVVFSEGDLASVMRASMSVPGAVAPAEYAGMTLVDGMLTSNLPVDAARAMGADIVIAVNVGTPLLKREQLNSILGVAGQMLSILTEQNVQASLASLKPTDILISPDLGDYSTGDFDNLAKITPLGEEAARKVADQLAQLSMPPAEYAALRQRQRAGTVPDIKPVDEIRFTQLNRVNPASAQAVMQTTVGTPLVQTQLDADMRRLYGTGDFEHVNYRILEEPGKRVLVVDAVEKAWGPNYLRAGIGLSSDFSGSTRFNVIANHRMTWLNSLGAELRTDLQLGFNNALQMEFYQPLDVRGRYFIAPRAAIGKDQVDLYSGNERVAIYDITSRMAGLDVGVQFDQYGELRLGIAGGTVIPKLNTGLLLLPSDEKVAQGGIGLRLRMDQLDSANFPLQGWATELTVYNSITDLGADDPYSKWRLGATGAYSIGNHTVHVSVAAGGNIGSNPLPAYDQFQWGGFLRQSGFATGQLVGARLQFGQVAYYHRLVRGGLFDGAFGGVSLEAGQYDHPLLPRNPSGFQKSMALFIGADSAVGPVYFGYGKAADGPGTFYFHLGRPQ
ncbi:MAG TPA: patatin-like phospholipase family protein [Burkholderiaceae bacterium]|nr:patatin-like phospholipase family protein [Burkholderiaceae bacterium]